jgi:hypothetical protein
MEKLSIMLLVLFSVFCVGCKKTRCPEFPSNLNYFPYYNEQELKFANSQQNPQSFTITSKENSKSEVFAWNCDCSCMVGSIFSANENRDSSNIEGYIHLYEGENVFSIEIRFKFQNREYLRKKIDLERPVFYNEVYKYLQDSIVIEDGNNQLIKKIVIVKDKGLVSYTTADGEEWNLVE